MVSPRIGAVAAVVMTLWLAPTVSRAAETPAAADNGTATSPPSRPRIGLVLSGGGARGAAHIGVLKVLDELHVPIDAIAGTSMGAVVGGLYASGLTAREIEAVMSSVNWQNAFRDRPPRNELSFRRKQEDFSFLVKFPLGIRGGKLQLPQGLIEGQSLTLTLRQLTLPVARVQEFQDLPTPFRAVATDLTTGEPVVMRAGDLTTAMRASVSAPGVFAPVERDGRLLVDGGIAENLPIDVAREMNVDILIVVDVGAALYTRERLGTATSISNQMLAILIRRDSQRQLATLTQRDVLVSPQLGEASSFDFGIVQRAIGAGELAARALAPRLRELAVSPEAYAAYTARRDSARSNPPNVAFIRVGPDSQQYSAPLHALFDDLVGKPLDATMTRRRIIDLYGRGNLAVLDYRVVPGDGDYGLDMTARRKSWGPNYVRFGLDLEDDFQGNAVYNAAARIVMSDMTRTGGEWVWDLQAGVSPHVYTEFFLPLSNAWTYFLLPHGQFIANNVPLIDSQGHEIAEYRVRTWEYGLDFGRQFSNWGELRAGLLHDHGTSRVRVGNPDEPETQFTDYGYFIRVSYDQLDDVGFPRDGALATVQWNSEKSRINEVVESPFNQLTFNWIFARSFGRETGVLWTTYGTTFNQTAPLDVHTQYTLGGFLNLSGLPAQSLAGPNYGIARAIFYRKVGRGGEGFFDFPTYLGVSLEAGNVWQERSDISWGSARKDASVFMGLDTLLGPLYLAYGYDYTGKEAFYLLLGHTF